MFTLDRRVRDLKDIENTHGNVVRQMGQCAGHADKPHLAGLFELQECLERAVFFQGLPRWGGVELHYVEIVGLHPDKTLFDPRHDVVAGEDVLPPLAARRRGSSDQAAAFAGQIIFSAPLRDIAADPLLGEGSQPVVIDWPNACRGDPAGDVCRSYLLLRLHAEEVADPYLDAYCRVSRVPRQNILDWLPFVTAARLTEDVPGELDRLLGILRSS